MRTFCKMFHPDMKTVKQIFAKDIEDPSKEDERSRLLGDRRNYDRLINALAKRDMYGQELMQWMHRYTSDPAGVLRAFDLLEK